MDQNKKISYITETPPEVQDLLNSVSASFYNGIASYFWFAFVIVFIVFFYFPPKQIKKVRGELGRRWKARTGLGFIWLIITFSVFLSYGDKPFPPLTHDEMPYFEGTYTWFTPGGKGLYSSIYLRKNGRKYAISAPIMGDDAKKIKALKKTDMVSVRVHLLRFKHRIRAVATEVNINGENLYKINKTYNQRLEEYESWGGYLWFWISIILLLSYLLFKETPLTLNQPYITK